MKKNLTKKLMLSVLTLAFAVVSLGASTFAWFTTSETADVETITTEVIGGSGIEIGVAEIGATAPAAYYVNELKSDKISALFGGELPVLQHISALSTGAETAFGEKLYDIDGDEVELEYDNTELGYIAFKLFVKVNAAGYVTLDTVNVTSSKTTNWNAGVAYTNGLGTGVEATASEDFSVTNAVRVAVVANYNTYATVGEELQATPAETINVYEQAAATGSTGNSKGFSNQGAYQIYNAKQNDEGSKLDILDDAVPNWNCKTLAESLAETDAIKAQVQRDEVITFDVYMWIEGYDAECVNAIFAHDVNLVLGFGWSAN